MRPLKRQFHHAFVVLFALGWATPAAAQECARFAQTNLNLLIDTSESMRTPAKLEVARDFALLTVDTLARSGRLARLGGIGFPDLPSPPGFNFAVTDTNHAAVRAAIDRLELDDLIGVGTPLYPAIETASDHLAPLADLGQNLLVVVTDGEDTSLLTEFAAASALADTRGVDFLIFAGGAGDPGATVLSDVRVQANLLTAIRGHPGETRYRTAEAATARELANYVLDAACRNYAPTSILRLSPGTELELGTEGFEIAFDASRSSDRETASADLNYQLTLFRPDGASFVANSGRGSTGAAHRRTFTDADLGRWTARLEVTDAEGVTTPSSTDFELLNAEPVVDVYGGGVLAIGDEIVFGQRTTADQDGGELEVRWTVEQAPTGGSFPVGHSWSSAEVRFPATAADVTLSSDGRILAPRWTFRVTLTDNERSAASAVVEVEVQNSVPELELGTSDVVRVGDELTLGDPNLVDPDGGELDFSWSVIQAPDSGELDVGRDRLTGATLSLPTTLLDAGSWIFELEATDDEGESVSDRAEVLVDAVPQIEVERQITLLYPSGTLELDASASVDPDSPCERPDYCHSNLEGPVRVSVGIAQRSWTVVDFPPQERDRMRIGEIDELFGIPGYGDTLELAASELAPGEWRLQLELLDGEDNREAAEVEVQVIDERGPPVAIVSPPTYRLVDGAGRLTEAVEVSAAASWDPDAPDAPLPGAGIAEVSWEVIDSPLCELPLASGSESAIWTPFEEGAEIPPDCHGTWFFRATVTDAGSPAQSSVSETRVAIGNCREPVCLLHPTTQSPRRLQGDTDPSVTVEYWVDSALLADLAPSQPFVRLEIVRSSDGRVVHEDFELDLTPGSSRTPLAFEWSGHLGRNPPREGTYDIHLVLAERTSLFDLRAPHAILHDRSPVRDCGDLWLGGYTNPDTGGALYCVEYEPELSRDHDFHVYYPPGWRMADPRNEQLLANVFGALDQSVETLSAISSIPPIDLVFDPLLRAPGTRADASMVTGAPPLFGPRCLIRVPLADALYSPVRARFATAHEVAHCLQYEWPLHSRPFWSGEGLAEYLANLVYPEKNLERELNYEPEAPLYFQDYQSVHFFQSAANQPDFGVEWSLGLMAALSGTNERTVTSVLGSRPDFARAFHTFAQEVVGSNIAWVYEPPFGAIEGEFSPGILDDGGGYLRVPLPSRPREVSASSTGLEVAADTGVERISPTEVRFELLPYTVSMSRLHLAPGRTYRVEISSGGADLQVSHLPAFQGVGRWQEIPSRFRPGCSQGDLWHLLVTSVDADPDWKEVTITVESEPDPDCP